MQIDNGYGTLGIVIAWFLREIISMLRKKNGTVSIDQKIDYLYKRELDKEAGNKAVDNYIRNHKKGS